MDMKQLSALEVLADRSCVSGRNAYKHERGSTHRSYLEGEAIAYTEAANIMRKELHRLCNLFQNSALQISDFNIVL